VPWGHESGVTAWAATWSYSPRDYEWDTYLGLHRSGALDGGIGATATYGRGDGRGFRLVAVVGRLLVAFEMYRSVIECFEIAGPFEVTLALLGTRGTYLGNVATGFRDQSDLDWRSSPAAEDGYLSHWEVDNFAGEAEVRGVTKLLGQWIENCWGSVTPRFVARSGPHIDDIDWSRFT
jgi:hypothetical protein